MLTNLLAYINTYGYKAIFLLIAIENLFPPIPCEIILTFGGFMTTITNLTPLGVITVDSILVWLLNQSRTTRKASSPILF